ncbi:MAG TPA: alpha/beta fold hydrolase [Puia sp.]|nr:alpha/beta fold hydrolase [Puia sp.]
MLPLSTDHTFHYELLRTIAYARSYGADIAEVLTVAEKIEAGNFESWYEHFNQLALHIHSNLPDRAHPVSLRNALFRAANYYRAADFFLHGNPGDARIDQLWKDQSACFDQAISLLDIPGERFEIRTPGFTIPGIFYKAGKGNEPRPTLLLCNGYDGSQEEMLHVFGFGALERGFNVITFEGPGQPGVVRSQGLGFITEWEKVVTPIVDHCQGLASVDSSRLILLGYSFGGFLVPRAAAFEHRLAAVVCVDGIFDVYSAFTKNLPPAFMEWLEKGDKDKLDLATRSAMQGNTSLRWGVEQRCWSFITDSPYEFLQQTRGMTMKGIAKNISCPVLVCEAEKDHAFAGQPALLVEALGGRATYRKLTAVDAAHEHCHVGAGDLVTSIVMDWISEQC